MGLTLRPACHQDEVIENCAATATSCTPSAFFMAVQGQPEKIFDPNAPPAIVSTQGTVELWTVENHAGENHEFHFHQVHFLVVSQNNFEINNSQQSPAVNGQYLDMIQVPYWDGNPNHPYPSVTLRIDFRGPDVGDFVFHCHILGHEDLGMMNIIQVVKPSAAKNQRGQPGNVVSDAKAGAHSAEMSPVALEVADRVIAPDAAGVTKSSVQSGGSHHRH